MRRRNTIRFRLTIGFVMVILAANTVVSSLTVLHIGNSLLDEVQTRVRLDLNSVQQVYDTELERLALFLSAVSIGRFRLAGALTAGTTSAAQDLLDEIRAEGRMDMLHLLDRNGRVLIRVNNPAQTGDDLSADPLVAQLLRADAAASGTVVIPAEVLAREGREIAERATFRILPTPAARPTARTLHADGMALAAVVPIRDKRGAMLGMLYAANLLNRRYDLVDRMRGQVFQNQTWEGKDIGTSTIFQDDLRITTNVLTMGGERAVGTLLSEEVYKAVVEQGEIWADRAFVVNDWYITAYQPIRDPDSRIIGALYVGLLEEPFAQPLRSLQIMFLVLMGLGTLLSLFLYFLVTRQILKPVGRIISLARRVKEGDLSTRVGLRPSGEMGVLCEAIDGMADAVVEREQQIRDLARRQIGQSEKLASLGRLAAGIAHEINNPLTGVLTFSHLLRERPYFMDQDRQDLDVIIRETTRVREIVRGLLDFARETPSVRKLIDLNAEISRTIRLFRSQKDVKITIEEQFDPELPRVLADANQLQQVFLNLSLNAREAMPRGGRLTFRTLRDGNRVKILVEDTGCGIPPEHMDKIFDPFFTTKDPGKGTGLGLSVSYGIIQQHGGTMMVDSTVGKGTCFTVLLPAAGEQT
ncbi:MAG: cache domain-containing protein [Deltaproteobacteria bacterium]|nr:cache domain-containing protein [Deltaproteobacteria bacterium]